ncbi:MAG: hypothetical protein AAF405_08000, partial [Pseudomonadota bacterium]
MSGATRKPKSQGTGRKRSNSRASAANKPASGTKKRACKPAARRRAPAKRRTGGKRAGLWASYKRLSARHPFLVKTARFSLFASLAGVIILAGAVFVFLARVPDPLLATLDDRPPNVTVLAADGSVLAERGLRRGHIRVDVLPKH